MERIKLESIIEKYHLGGLCEAVQWKIQDHQLSIRFISPNRDMAGEVKCSSFMLENSNAVIYNTTQLSKLIGVMDKNINLNLSKSGKVFTKLYISDETFNVTYALTDPMMAPTTPDVNEPDTYDIELKLDKNYVNNLIKAKNSITNDNTMGIQDDRNLYGNSILKFIFGGENDYSNKITYDIPLETNTPHIIISELLTFDSDLFKTILNANKSFNHMSMKINTQGLMRLEFVYDDVTSEYFILKKADI